MSDVYGHEGSNLRHLLGVLRRRKWIALQPVLVVPAAAVVFSLFQQPMYEASSEVLLSNRDLAGSLTGTQDPRVFQQAERLAETQAQLARVPELAARTLDAAGVSDRTAADFLEQSDVEPKQNADLLEFSVTDEDADLATTLSAEYASEFTEYRTELDTAALERTRLGVEEQMAELEAAGAGDSAFYTSLAEQQQQLLMLESLQAGNAFVARAADHAAQVSPRTIRNAVIAAVLGIMLGIGLAFLVEALDTRVRSEDEIASMLGLTLLTRVPEPSRRIRRANQLVMLAEPAGPAAEPFRVLRSNLDFVNHELGASLMMVTSAHPGEGKSTSAGNLAVALARAGQKVALVDLDLRRPFLHELFGIEGSVGLTSVALGRMGLSDALVPIGLPSTARDQPLAAPADTDREGATIVEQILELRGTEARTRPQATNGRGFPGDARAGQLEVLASGPLPPNPGEFVATSTLERIMEQLRERSDIVLIDAPPLLHLGDALALSAKADAVLLVARLGVTRRQTVGELRRIASSMPAPVLGVIVTGAKPDRGYGYRYHGTSAERAWEESEELSV